MLGFWGTVAVVLVLFVVLVVFLDRRRRAGGSGLSDRERAAFDRRNGPYRSAETFGGGGGRLRGWRRDLTPPLMTRPTGQAPGPRCR